MVKIFFLLLVVPISIFCSPAYVSYSARVEKEHCAEVCKKYGLKPFGSGGGMMFDVEHIHQSYISHQALDVAQARRLYIAATQDLLSRMSASKALRPYLRNYPFQPENITYFIHFEDKRSKPVPAPYVSSVGSGCGSDIFYTVQDGTSSGQELYRETYEEALRIVQAEKLQKTTQSQIVMKKAP